MLLPTARASLFSVQDAKAASIGSMLLAIAVSLAVTELFFRVIEWPSIRLAGAAGDLTERLGTRMSAARLGT